jgi:hypothetical protein
VILALACLGHVGLILLLVQDLGATRRRVQTREPEPLLLVWLDSLVRPEPRPPAEMPAPVLTPPANIFTMPLPEIDSPPSESAISPPVPDSVPRVDWTDERHREIATVVKRQSDEAARPKIGRPPSRGTELPPPEPFEHKRGDIEHGAGGETIEWINNRCYYTTKPSPVRNRLSLMLPTCKSRANAPRKEIRVDRPPPESDLP